MAQSDQQTTSGINMKEINESHNYCLLSIKYRVVLRTIYYAVAIGGVEVQFKR